VSLFDEAPKPSAGRGPLRYQRVIDLVDEIIRAQDLQPGSLLPTQKQLAGLAGVSLITVRRALDELEREGRVAGHQGVGTFVARPRIVSEPARRGGLLATLAGRGASAEVTTEVLKVRNVEPDAGVAGALGLAPGARVWHITRLRRIDARPMMLEQARVPQALAPDLGGRRDELKDSLYGLLARSYGLVDDYEEQYLEVDAGAAAERRRLELPGRSRIVRLRGVSFTAGDVPFDCFEHVYPAEAFAFYISGRTSRRLLPAQDLAGWRRAGSGRSR
jgi:GntR family transcriptional regulator